MAGLFRTAMSGFKKSDVLEFIDKQEYEFKTSETKLKAEIEELKKSIDEMAKKMGEQKAQNDELLSRNTGLATELVREGEENASLLARIESLTQDLSSRQEERLKSEALNDELRHEIAIHKQNFEAKSAELAEKSVEIEKLNNTISRITTTQTRISRVMVEAQNTADQIIDNAKIQAAALLMRADKKLSNALESAHDFGCEVESLRAKVGSYTSGIDKILTDVREYTSQLSGAGMPAAESCIAATTAREEPTVIVADGTKEVENKPKPTSAFDFSFDGRRYHNKN